MDRSKDKYDIIKKNIIFEDKIYYNKKDRKLLIGCLIKSKYGDETDNIEFYLFENKTSPGPFICLNLIEYQRAEKYIEQKKNQASWLSRSPRMMFSFELIPKHQQQKEIFHCETEENRIKWLKELNEIIEKLKTNGSYDGTTYMKQTYVINLNEDLIEEGDDNTSEINSELHDENIEFKPPPIPPRNISWDPISNENIKRKSLENVSSSQLKALNKVNKILDENDIIYPGPFEELNKILCQINISGVYAVSQKVKPEFNCTWAIRVYEKNQTLISSWNIYENKETNKYSLYDIFDNGLNFSSITELCSYYTKNDLPGASNEINRLTVSYKHHYH